jgi:hypothetical protein
MLVNPGIWQAVHLAPQATELALEKENQASKEKFHELSHCRLLLSAIRFELAQIPWAFVLTQRPFEKNVPSAHSTHWLAVGPVQVLHAEEQAAHEVPLRNEPSRQGVPVESFGSC